MWTVTVRQVVWFDSGQNVDTPQLIGLARIFSGGALFSSKKFTTFFNRCQAKTTKLTTATLQISIAHQKFVL